MAKRLLGAFLSVIMTVCIVSSFSVFEETVYAETEGIYTYTVSDNKATITGFNSYVSGEITIPSTLGGYPVTSIGFHAFYGCINLTKVIISNNTTNIGESAFAWCISLNSAIIPNSVTSIGSSAFEKCESLTSVTIPNSVTSIGDYAFRACGSLTSMNIPGSVSNIGEGAFARCICLASINVESNNGYYLSQNGVLYNKIKSIIITYPCGKSGGYTIPNSVTSIGESAFAWCGNLTSVIIPNSITLIGDYMFYNCISLTSVTIPNSVTSIGDNAFDGCYSLTNITVPDSIRSIGVFAFLGCKSMTSVTIPNNVTIIEHGTFDSCSSLTTITIPSSVTSIEDWAFAYCSSLISVAIPNSVTSIGVHTFSYCSSYPTIYCSAGSYAESFAKNNDLKYAPLREFPFGITRVTVINNSITVNTANYYNATENLPILLIGIYDGQDKLIKIIKKDIMINTDIYSIDTDIPSEMATVRVYIWENLTNMIPVAAPGEYVKS